LTTGITLPIVEFVYKIQPLKGLCLFMVNKHLPWGNLSPWQIMVCEGAN